MFYAYTRPRYQVSIYRTIDPLVFCFVIRFFMPVAFVLRIGAVYYAPVICNHGPHLTNNWPT